MNSLRFSGMIAACLLTPTTHAGQIDLELIQAYIQGPGGARPGSAEILDFTKDQNTVVSTMDGTDGYGVQILTLGFDGTLAERGLVDFGSIFGSADPDNDAISATAADPKGRGFGVVGLIPEDNGGTVGKVGFYDYRAGSADASRDLVTLDVGYHPDSIKFSADGTRIFVADEGEYTSGGDTDAPGSLTVIDISSVNEIGDLTGLGAANVATYDFSAANLSTGVSLASLRFNDTTFTPGNEYLHVEPEYIAEANGKVYVTLQENNAVAALDLTTDKWTDIQALGTIAQTVDASDRDGPGGDVAARIDDLVKGMPMPDTIATYEVGGKLYYVTANEGDFRVDDGDRIRVKDLDPAKFSAALATELEATYGSVADAQGDDLLGRLRVQDLDGIAGTPEGTQIYDELLMPGTRSFSIWDAATGALVSDTGSLEPLLLTLDPLLHNIDDGDPAEFDKRSDDKGPEPEALSVAYFLDRWLAFVGMERQNGLLVFDITDPTKPSFEGYINSLMDGLVSPESLVVISAQDSPTGSALVLAGYEQNDGGIGVYGVTVPVPASILLLLPGLVLIARRRTR